MYMHIILRLFPTIKSNYFLSRLILFWIGSLMLSDVIQFVILMHKSLRPPPLEVNKWYKTATFLPNVKTADTDHSGDLSYSSLFMFLQQRYFRFWWLTYFLMPLNAKNKIEIKIKKHPPKLNKKQKWTKFDDHMKVKMIKIMQNSRIEPETSALDVYVSKLLSFYF